MSDGGSDRDASARPGAADPDGWLASARRRLSGEGWPNRNTLWGHVVLDELAKAGVDAVCVAPGSRSTPLTVAAAAHPDVAALSHLDERSAAFFALGRARRTGRPAPLICTSGTAAANFHPAVVEADRARVPAVALTADRPPELRDSGANQTIDQERLYGGAVRAYRTLPEPAPDPRRLRSLRVAVDRAVATAMGTPPGPVHLNVPFAKPLEPTPVPGDVPDGFDAAHPLAARGRSGRFVAVRSGRPALDDGGFDGMARAVAGADRGLIVAGPDAGLGRTALGDLARATGFPTFADPLSGLRFGAHVRTLPVFGGYDAYAPALPPPDVVVRVGASPTSKPLREWLRDADCRQFVIDPAGGWREATFTATDLVVAAPASVARGLADRVDRAPADRWHARIERAERAHWQTVDGAGADAPHRTAPPTPIEGGVLADAAAIAPDPATLFVSNSMPVRDLDRFGRPRSADLTVLGNRGASGIDGIVSTALGAGHGTDDPLVAVVGDLALYHDANGLLAVRRLAGGDVPRPVRPDHRGADDADADEADATVVLVNNDGGGIFHLLPIEGFDPPFTEYFRTPHGLDFGPLAELYGFDHVRVDSREAFREAYRASLASSGVQLVEVVVDAEESHRRREALAERLREALGTPGG
jgi:2-succinyl-5-enolpyruvyl-6-hydroxy-3-cyclohexene-1-carboxylate synthase